MLLVDASRKYMLLSLITLRGDSYHPLLTLRPTPGQQMISRYFGTVV